MRPKFPSLITALFLAFLIPVLPAAADDHVSNAETLKSFADLVIEANYGLAETERAAFIVRTSEGRYALDLWPASHSIRKSVWKGPLPANAVAIVHTHPQGMPLPSSGDRQEARRLGIPIYVLARSSIYRVDPSGGDNVRLIAQSDWWKPHIRERALRAKTQRETPRTVLASASSRTVHGPAW